MLAEVWVLLGPRTDICISRCGLDIGVGAKDEGDAFGTQVSWMGSWMQVVTSL